MKRRLIAVPLVGLLFAGCGTGTKEADHRPIESPPPATTQNAVPPETPREASVFHVTSATVTYIKGSQVPRDITIDPDLFPANARVAKVRYTWRNDGTKSVAIAPEKLYDVQGREFTGEDPTLPYDQSNFVVPGLQGRGTVYLTVGNAKIAATAFEAWGAQGEPVDPSLGYAVKHTTDG
jgi:hypothetical protein